MTRGLARAPRPARDSLALEEIGLDAFAPYLMNRIMGLYNDSLREALRRRGLTTPQMRALAVLAVGDGVTINEMAALTVTEQSTMSRTLDAMEVSGLVRRETAAHDSRVRRIFLTDDGRALFDDVWPVMRAAVGKLFSGVSDAEYATLVATLRKMLGNVAEEGR